MRIYYAENYEKMSRKAADILAAQVTLKPDSVLGLATGATPVGLYRALAVDHREHGLSFSKCRTVNLDEYCGLAADHPQSYAYFMQKMLFSNIDICPEHTYLPDGKNIDADAECQRYDALLASLGGIDLQLLGIGHNGHIGFNEPAACFSTGTHRIRLTESTIHANARFFVREEEMPEYAYTMGIRPIVQARRILLVVSGAEKAEILEQALFGPVTPHVPASILQLVPDLIVCGEAGALSDICSKHSALVTNLP